MELPAKDSLGRRCSGRWLSTVDSKVSITRRSSRICFQAIPEIRTKLFGRGEAGMQPQRDLVQNQRRVAVTKEVEKWKRRGKRSYFSGARYSSLY